MRSRYLAVLLAGLVAAACGDDSDSVDAGPDANLTGTFTIGWTVNGGSEAEDCAAVGAETVRIQVIEVDAATGQVVPFSCAAGSGVSRELVPGTYRLTIDLRSAGGDSLIADPIVVNDVEVPEAGNVDVDPVAFTVESTGALRFAASSEGVADNCSAAADGGAGIQGLRFNLLDGSGTCVPTEFDAGAETYMSDCTDAPTPIGCIESSQDVSVDSTSSGARTLQVIGIVDGAPCRKHINELTIPGNQLELSLGTVSMALDTAEAGCETM